MTATLDENNFLLVAAKAYSNPHCLDLNEFYQDVAKIRQFGKNLSKYKRTGSLKMRTIINQLIFLFNVFETEGLVSLLVYKNYQNLDALVPMLRYLGYIREYHLEGPFGPDHATVNLNEVQDDKYILDELTRI